jgi:predicted nucleic acid-binding protein
VAAAGSATGLIDINASHGLSIPDALIAATAVEHGIALYTRGLHHFQMIPALTIHRPY